MVEDILIFELGEECRARAKEIREDMDLECRGSLCFKEEKIYFDAHEDDILDEEEDIYMIYTRGSLKWE